MLAGNKVRLYPTKEQEELFWKFSGAARFVYNICLSYKIDEYQSIGYSCSIQDLTKYIQDLKYSGNYDWLNEVPEAITKQSIKDLYNAYRRFFRRGNKGFPKFKKRNKCKPSFYQRIDRFRVVDAYHLKITGIKDSVRVRSSDNIPISIKNPRVTYDGKYWYFSYSYEIEEQSRNDNDTIIGVDLGIERLAVTSSGTVYRNINKDKNVRQLEKRLRHLQRNVSRKYEVNKEGNKYVKTRNIIKLENQIRLVHRRLGNIRDTYIHEVTYDLVKTKPGCIVIEDLNVSGMMKNKNLSKFIQQQEFYKFRQYLTYKCKFYGVKLIVANRFYASSKLCSRCNNKHKTLSLSQRTYICSKCGLVLDRDLNAAINLENYGRRELTKAS